MNNYKEAKTTAHPKAILDRHPLAKQWSGLSVGTLAASNRRTVDLNEIVDGIPKGDMKFSLGHGGFGGRLEAPPNGD